MSHTLRTLAVFAPAFLLACSAGVDAAAPFVDDDGVVHTSALVSDPSSPTDPIDTEPTDPSDPYVPPPPPAYLGRMRISVTNASCKAITSDESALVGSPRDEIYMLVATNINGTKASRQFPANDDYYEFWSGTTDRWTNQNGASVGAPTFVGPRYFNEGDQGTIFVQVMEQDNNWLNETFGNWFGELVNGLPLGYDKLTTIALLKGRIPPSTEALPGLNEHDRVGAFEAQFKIVNGKVVMSYGAVLDGTTVVEDGLGGATVTMTGKASRYTLKLVGQKL